MNERGCVPLKLYLWKCAVDWIWPAGYSCQPLGETALEFNRIIGVDYHPSIGVSPVLSRHRST